MCLDLRNLSEHTLEEGDHAGFHYQIVHNGMGYRCGYVRVYPGHPWFGKHYDDVPAEVHGGLTFAKAGTACPTHDEKAEHWLGFDCAHAWDSPDPALPNSRRDIMDAYNILEERHGYEVRTQEYVRAQCFSLCEQAKNALDAVTAEV